MKKSGSSVLSLNQITSVGYRNAGEVDLRFKWHVRESKRKSLFVSMITQAIKASIIQATCRETIARHLAASCPKTPNVVQTVAEQCKCSRAITNKELQEDVLQNYR